MDDVFCNIACCPLSSHCGITPKSIDKKLFTAAIQHRLIIWDVKIVQRW